MKFGAGLFSINSVLTLARSVTLGLRAAEANAAGEEWAIKTRARPQLTMEIW